MERKRKLPARAAARVEHVAKKRTVTPPEPRSVTPVPVTVEEPPPPPPSLPKSIQAGKPLPTVEDAQPDDLPAKEYQSFQESGVLAESLSRSRHKWLAEGLFEKYWTKPGRKKNATEDPKNPPKDTMSKIGPCTITIEPHAHFAIWSSQWSYAPSAYTSKPEPKSCTRSQRLEADAFRAESGTSVTCSSATTVSAAFVGCERATQSNALAAPFGAYADRQCDTTSATAGSSIGPGGCGTSPSSSAGNAITSRSSFGCGTFSTKLATIELNANTGSGCRKTTGGKTTRD
ncbi:uncharacterized protein N0V96_000231 [Colletotrichum fioriniae]|uniref:uncharacterized protein n=1 Tax=Colletotrichum fioriniae TaxID=710243 RepID=UPI0032DACC7B|nr:hypothetical protein N0V96_000231 [Colletotrichum fioriniae]